MHQIDLTKIDLNLLVVFEALTDECHVGRAATRMHLSPAATSHALGRLRRLFEDPLFVRRRSGMEPTLRAKELAEPLAKALAQVRQLVRPAASFDPATLERNYTVATDDLAIMVLLTKMQVQLRNEAPRVGLHCVGSSHKDLIASFDRGIVDFACGVFSGFQAQRIERISLFEDRFIGMVGAAHPALRSGRLELDAFIGYPHIVASSGDGMHSPVDEALRTRGLNRRVAMTVPNNLSVLSVVNETELISVMPARLAESITGSHNIAVFDLPIVLEPFKCELIAPARLAEADDFSWIADCLKRAACPLSA